MCTALRFTDNQGNMYFGRNLDWCCGYGQQVVVTPRNWHSSWRFEGEYTTDRAVIGMAIIQQDTPLYFDAANEHGLAVAGLNFPGFAQYESKAIEGKTNVAAFEFPLWVVENFTSVDEVEEKLAHVAIVDEPFSKDLPSSMLHWIIGDATRSIVVEYMADGIHIYHDDVDVLANQPTFSWHQENLRSYVAQNPDVPQEVNWRSAQLSAYGSGAGMRGIPGDYYSTSRFVKVAYLNAFAPETKDEDESVMRLFHILLNVGMVDGGARMSNGQFERTVYTGGYSAKTHSYYYNTYEDLGIKRVSLDEHADAADLVSC